MAQYADSELASQWRERLARFDRSELTVAEFCRLEEYSVAAFYYWRAKLQALGQRPDYCANLKASPSSGIDLITTSWNPRNQGLTMTNVPQKRNSEEIASAIKIDGDAVRSHLDELVRSTVEETLNKLLDAEADQL